MATPTDYWEWQEHEADIERSEERAEARARGMVADCDLPLFHPPDNYQPIYFRPEVKRDHELEDWIRDTKATLLAIKIRRQNECRT